mmetsp:Transcript_35104/g.68814  ORF Transcript_35104/g.68814 Transcript_35104/m.68814 type:complete len:203 (-) Transcript_35104:13-621(-)
MLSVKQFYYIQGGGCISVAPHLPRLRAFVCTPGGPGTPASPERSAHGELLQAQHVHGRQALGGGADHRADEAGLGVAVEHMPLGRQRLGRRVSGCSFLPRPPLCRRIRLVRPARPPPRRLERCRAVAGCWKCVVGARRARHLGRRERRGAPRGLQRQRAGVPDACPVELLLEVERAHAHGGTPPQTHTHGMSCFLHPPRPLA